MTIQEKQKLKTAKSTHKSVKKNYPLLHRQLKDEMIRTLVKSKTPEWSNLTFTVTKHGV